MTTYSTDTPSGYVNQEIPWASFATAAASHLYASDLTHGLYKYPARLSPPLARALILGLTKPGDVVLDPFAGGGTTAIEALFHGRQVIVSDINSLACFVTMAKAWPATPETLRRYAAWVKDATNDLESSAFGSIPLITRDGNRYAPRTHAALLNMSAKAGLLPDASVKRLALLTTLRCGQLCFDCRRKPPSVRILQAVLKDIAHLVIKQMRIYSEACRSHTFNGGFRRALSVVHSDAEKLAFYFRKKSLNTISLVLTSPPYPGVHVLYHRWQIYGRKEISLPYHLLDLSDGSFESYYTLAARSSNDTHYFARITSIFSSLLHLLSPTTVVAQVIGFADPENQLPRYRNAMMMAGYEEIVNPLCPDSPLERTIPRRKWYAELATKRTGSNEFLLLYRPSQADPQENDKTRRNCR